MTGRDEALTDPVVDALLARLGEAGRSQDPVPAEELGFRFRLTPAAMRARVKPRSCSWRIGLSHHAPTPTCMVMRRPRLRA